MAARANFSCTTCAKEFGQPEFVHKNLPVTSKHCPVCGYRRGFKRLYDAIQVSTKGRRIAKFVDGQLGPAYEKHSQVTDSSKRFQDLTKEAAARAYEVAPPKSREAIAAIASGSVKPGMHMPAGAALSAIDPAARRDTRELVYPALTGRQVRPEWARK